MSEPQPAASTRRRRFPNYDRTAFAGYRFSVFRPSRVKPSDERTRTGDLRDRVQRGRLAWTRTRSSGPRQTEIRFGDRRRDRTSERIATRPMLATMPRCRGPIPLRRSLQRPRARRIASGG
jgi:hypothetical protein